MHNITRSITIKLKLWIYPGGCSASSTRNDKINSALDALTLGSFVLPQIDADFLANVSYPCICNEIERGVMLAASSDEFQRLRAVGTDIGIDTSLHPDSFLLGESFISNENGNACLLHRRKCAVVIRGCTFLDAEWAVREPI